MKVSKIGLLNFWLYDEEEFDFYGGKLILRGSNGSGKSVTMQSFIPLILDGNKAPDRLDPFGSKERKIEDYILGTSDSIQKEEATSYLYMEIYNEEKKTYLTIGLGLKARKGRPVESWGFCLKDGSRINKDFYLYKDPIYKIPLSKNELKARLGTINEFVDNMKDYKAMVNRLIFGFPNLLMYDEFIKLLLQLRSNKLSKDYKPTNLIDVLNKVLQPLTEEDLRPLSEAIEQMNKTKEQIETLEKNIKCLKDFLKVYHNYNELLLYTKAKNYKNSYDNYNDYLKRVSELENNINNLKNDWHNKKLRYDEVCKKIQINKGIKSEIDNSDLNEKIESLEAVKVNIKSLKEKINLLANDITNKEEEKIRISKDLSRVNNQILELKDKLETITNDIKDISLSINFQEINNYELSNINDDSWVNSLNSTLQKYKNKVSEVLQLLLEQEKIELENESTKIDFEKLNNEYIKLENSLKKEENNLKESIMSWQEDFINKQNNNQELKLADGIKKQILSLIADYTEDNFNEAKELYNETASDQINVLTADNLKIENKLNLMKKDLSLLENEYLEIETKDDLELPSFSEETDQILNENNIKNIPLYKCLEFKENISAVEKDSLEASLLDLNILNAKIIDEKDLSKINNLNLKIFYLTKSTKKKNNLLKYFNIVIDEKSGFSKEYLKDILESISIDENDLVNISSNKAHIDFLNSKPSKDYRHCYIGYLKRLELKKQKLEELKQEIDILKKEITNLDNIIKSNLKKIDIIKIEKDNLPNNQFIKNVLLKINNINQSLQWTDNKQKEIEEKLTVINNSLKKLNETILIKKQGLTIPLNKESYQEVISDINNMKELLSLYINAQNSYISKTEIFDNYQERLEDLINNIAYQVADKNEKEISLELNKEKEKNINELLNTVEFQEQKEKLMKVEKELSSLETEKENLIQEIAKLEQNQIFEEEKLKELVSKKEKLAKELEIYKDFFIREYKLGYIYDEEIDDINITIKKILNDNSNRKDKNLNDAQRNLFESYNHYKLELNDYSLRTIELFNDYEEKNEDYQELYNFNSRTDIVALYQGIKLNLLNLNKKLETDLLENKDLINEQDRYLFEEILLNTVGEKIRDRINSSNEWVKKINNIMQMMQENSALRFKLVWKNNVANNENEIDTKELIRILKINPTALKEEDSDKLINHFRSKIKKAEELYADSYTPFAKIMEEVLDYRSWFTFQLLYQRNGEDFKELTDKTFSKFSGGERAKSMYIPLFASVYAKLNLARNNSLRLIALDEAFAGVDEDNIREMFGILKFLDIDFIINSQVLWGDYDTVSDLSICELIRPHNSKVVGVERYRWNGTYKKIINNRKEFNDNYENS